MKGGVVLLHGMTKHSATGLAAFLGVLAAAPAFAQGGSELFLLRLHQHDGRLAADSVVRLTNRVGYDNQPAFLPDASAILYTVIDATTHSDIWRYDLVSRVAAPVTRTQPESEYSATPMPGSTRFSVVRVEADSTQRLWSFKRDGSDARLLLEDVKPVGYHAWLDADHVVAFVLGNPASLQLVDVPSGATQRIAQNVGRALQRVPGRNAFSYVQRNADSTSSIVLYDVATAQSEVLIATLPQNEYHVWLKDGTLISASGSLLYQWRPGDRDWTLLADLSGAGVSGITRLAISPDERLLVIVAADGGKR